MRCNRSLLPVVAAGFALSISVAARAGAVPSGETHAKVAAGDHAASDAVRHSVNRAAEASERASKRALAATSRGIHTALGATKRGLDTAGRAVEHAAEKTKDALSVKHDDR